MNDLTPHDLFSVFGNGSLFMGGSPINRPPGRWKNTSSKVQNFKRNPRVFDTFRVQRKHRKWSSSDGSGFWVSKCDIVYRLKKKKIPPAAAAFKRLHRDAEAADRPRVKHTPPILTLVRRGGKSSFGVFGNVNRANGAI